MTEPSISKDFTMEDIRRLRDYNSERHSAMTHEEILTDIRGDADKRMLGRSITIQTGHSPTLRTGIIDCFLVIAGTPQGF